MLTDPAGIALYANEAAERRTGFSVGEVVGKAPGKLWGGHMPRAFYAKFWEAIEEKREPFVGTVENERKDKTRYEELLAVAPLLGQEETAYYMAFQMSHLRDVRERSRFAEEFRKVFSERRFTEKDRFSFMLKSLGAKQGAGMSEVSVVMELEEALVKPFAERFQARRADSALVLAAKADPEKFQAIYEKYRRSVLSHFLRHLQGDRELSEDLAQDTFFRALQYLHGFECSNASYGTYLLRVAHSVLLNHFRKKQPLFSENVPETAVFGVDPASDALLWQSKAVSEREQRLLRMKYQEGFSAKEIGTMLGKSENAVKLALGRARKKLRRSLEER